LSKAALPWARALKAARETARAFAAYAGVCFRELGDCVDRWITLNEPLCAAYLGYYHGVHAPGVKDLGQALRAVHHLNLAHGLAVEAYRKTGLKAPIGITWNLSTPRPATGRREDAEAAAIIRASESEVFTGPVFGRGYPERLKDLGFRFPVEDGDMEQIARPIDFVGLNFYSEGAATRDEAAPLKAGGAAAWQDVSDMGWPSTPWGLLRQLRWARDLSRGLPLFVTENGYANPDTVTPDGRVHDRPRIEYLKRHLEACAQAVAEGVPLRGYYAWSLLDNFEWAWGYTRRFGLVHVDYATQKRTPKDSAYFFRDVIAGYGEW